MIFPGDILRQSLKRTTALHQRNVCKAVGFSFHQPSFTAGEALVLWLMELLYRECPISTDQQALIFEHFGKKVLEIGNLYARTYNTDETVPVHLLVVADRRIAWLQGSSLRIDLTTGERDDYQRPDRLPVRCDSYGLTQLFANQLLPYIRKGLIDAVPTDGQQDGSGSVVEPADVRDEPVDAVL